MRRALAPTAHAADYGLSSVRDFGKFKIMLARANDRRTTSLD